MAQPGYVDPSVKQEVRYVVTVASMHLIILCFGMICNNGTGQFAVSTCRSVQQMVRMPTLIA